MASAEELRKNLKQHKAKNTKSKIDDKAIYLSMRDCIDYLQDRFKKQLSEYSLDFRKEISYEDIISTIRKAGVRKDFDTIFNTRTIKPDGGVILLRKKHKAELGRIVLVSEVKRQGTNKDRIKEGKPKQAQGNAIERLGKNLIRVQLALRAVS